MQNISELASKSSYIECLINHNVVEIVMPLTVSGNPAVRMNAVLGLARLAGNSELCVKQILCSKNLLNRILGQITTENVSKANFYVSHFTFISFFFFYLFIYLHILHSNFRYVFFVNNKHVLCYALHVFEI